MKQYIGARYVPKFADPIVWDNTRSYEALEIVTYYGSSYTSKIPVPVGIDINNTTYWVLTSDYSAQVAAYKAEVDDLKRNFNRKYIFVGDSFMTGYVDGITYIESFVKKACDALGLVENTDYYVAAQDGAGYNNGQLLAKLISIAGNIQTPDDITDVYIIAGTNDVGQDPTSAVGTIVNYCNSTYPNAKVAIGYNVFQLSGYNGAYDVQYTRSRVLKAAIDNGAKYFNGFAWCLTEDCRDSYGAHPNTYGQTVMGRCLTSYITGEEYHAYTYDVFVYTPVIGSEQYLPTISALVSDDVVTISNNTEWRIRAATYIGGDSGWIKIGEVNSGATKSIAPFTVPATIVYADTTYITVNLNMKMSDKEIFISVTDTTTAFTSIDHITIGDVALTMSRSL